ncbi:MAG: 2-amino-4-hydroxy-6-hydroxymethyldihydropteridine diphosphokinase [Pseudomonadales bacterium]|nr:2-amino-4-hydroxy-6-hydroxymethyldihydropteridine diphosphokinase [Pseudomonadales bacterium]
METTVYVALGSNLGDRHANIRLAIARLADLAVGAVEASSMYETDPQEMEDDAGMFVNAAARFRTALEPRTLLAALQKIEADLGRPPDHGFNTSRTIDLDLIAFGDRIISEAGLEVPHPRAADRVFVLMPLAEIDSGLRLPGTKGTVREMLRSILERGESGADC